MSPCWHRALALDSRGDELLSIRFVQPQQLSRKENRIPSRVHRVLIRQVRLGQRQQQEQHLAQLLDFRAVWRRRIRIGC